MSMWLVNTQPTFGVAFAPDGDQASVGSDVEVTVTRADGTALATDVAATVSGSGTSTSYQWTLPVAQNTRPDVLTLVWHDTSSSEKLTTTEELVGSLLFTEADAQGFDDGKLANVADIDIIETHDRIAEMFEEFCGVSFIPRYARGRFQGASARDRYKINLFDATLDEGGPGAFRHIRSVINADDDGTTVSGIELDKLSFRRTDTVWSTPTIDTPYPITVDWSYGFQRVPRDIKRAALITARYELVVHDVTDRMITYSDPTAGTVRLSIPGKDRPTGIPLVDQTLNRYRQTVSIA